MRLKTGVRLHPSYAMAYALVVAQEILGPNCVVTSGREGKHMTGSLHYTGFAVDLQSHQVYKVKDVLNKLRIALGPDFDVLLEDEGQPNEHFHVEFQPHTPVVTT